MPVYKVKLNGHTVTVEASDKAAAVQQAMADTFTSIAVTRLAKSGKPRKKAR